MTEVEVKVEVELEIEVGIDGLEAGGVIVRAASMVMYLVEVTARLDMTISRIRLHVLKVHIHVEDHGGLSIPVRLVGRRDWSGGSYWRPMQRASMRWQDLNWLERVGFWGGGFSWEGGWTGGPIWRR